MNCNSIILNSFACFFTLEYSNPSRRFQSFWNSYYTIFEIESYRRSIASGVPKSCIPHPKPIIIFKVSKAYDDFPSSYTVPKVSSRRVSQCRCKKGRHRRPFGRRLTPQTIFLTLLYPSHLTDRRYIDTVQTCISLLTQAVDGNPSVPTNFVSTRPTPSCVIQLNANDRPLFRFFFYILSPLAALPAFLFSEYWPVTRR